MMKRVYLGELPKIGLVDEKWAATCASLLGFSVFVGFVSVYQATYISRKHRMPGRVFVRMSE